MFKGTKEEAYFSTGEDYQIIDNAIGQVHTGTKIIVNILYGTEATMFPTEEQATANGHLIAEAFNVVNETGYTPKQLAEQNKELLSIVKELTKVLDNYSQVYDYDESKLVGKALTAIKNAKQ